MYAVIQLGSDQFKVQEGDVIEAHLMNSKEGDTVDVDQVLMFAKGPDIRIGQPFLKDVKVSGKIVGFGKSDKVIAFKYRRTKNSASIRGHRQKFTSINITKIAV